MSNMTSLEKSCFYSNFVDENIYRRGTFYAKEDRHCSFFYIQHTNKATVNYNNYNQQWYIVVKKHNTEEKNPMTLSVKQQLTTTEYHTDYVGQDME